MFSMLQRMSGNKKIDAMGKYGKFSLMSPSRFNNWVKSLEERGIFD
jgi:hypothetical protein